jgi:GT2 family glycosyltransferase
VIAVGVCIGTLEHFERWTRPTIERCIGSDSPLLLRRGATSIHAAYNTILDEAALLPGLEALVLLHDDVEVRDERLADKLRALFSDPSIGLVGVLGARNVTSIAYWEGTLCGRLGVDTVDSERIDDFGAETADVDAVDGCFLALSPFVVRHVRFDERLFTGFHAYDIDFSFAVRAAGKRVVVSDLRVHHHRRDGFPDRRGWLRSNIHWRAKWGFAPHLGVIPRLVALAIRAHASSVHRRLRAATRSLSTTRGA